MVRGSDLCPCRIPIYCPCGGSYNITKGVKERHDKTVRHIKYLYIPKRPSDDTSTTRDYKVQNRRFFNKPRNNGGYYAKK